MHHHRPVFYFTKPLRCQSNKSHALPEPVPGSVRSARQMSKKAAIIIVSAHTTSGLKPQRPAHTCGVGYGTGDRWWVGTWNEDSGRACRSCPGSQQAKLGCSAPWCTGWTPAAGWRCCTVGPSSSDRCHPTAPPSMFRVHDEEKERRRGVCDAELPYRSHRRLAYVLHADQGGSLMYYELQGSA